MKKFISLTFFGLTILLGLFALPVQAAGFHFSRNLQFHSSGTDVTALQSLLSQGGYFSVSPTGYFGTVTFTALKKWQAANGIPSTGYFGPLSRAAANGGVAVTSGVTSSNVTMVWPLNGSTLNQSALLYASVSSAVSATSVQFIVDGSLYGSPIPTSPYFIEPPLSPGSHTVTARAIDTNGIAYDSLPVSFTVVDTAATSSASLLCTSTSTPGCGGVLSSGGGGGGGGASGPSVAVSIIPPAEFIASNATTTFTAIVQNSPNPDVTWSALLGTIDSNGNYIAPTVVADPTDVITATSMADPTKSASINVGVSPIVSLNSPATVSNATGTSFAFRGNTSSTVNVAITGVSLGSGGSGCFTGGILNSFGVTLASTSSCSTNLSFPNIMLPATDTYTVFLNTGSSTASSTFTVTHPLAHSLSFNTPLSVSSSFAGQTANVTFTGTASATIDLAIDGLADTGSGNDRFGNYYCNTTINVLNPDGTTLVSNNGSCSGGTAWNDLALSQTGTYTISLSPGSYALTNATIDMTAPITGALSLNTPVNVSSSFAGQTAAYTFTGTASGTVNVAVTGITDSSGHYSFGVYYCSTDITIVNPDGTTLVSNYGNCGTNQVWNNLVTPQTGTYTVYLNPYSYTLTSATVDWANSPFPLTESLALNTPLTVSSSFATQLIDINFSGNASETIDLSINGLADTGSGNDRFGNYYCNTTINVLNPDGTTLVSNNGSCSGGTAWNDLALSQTGTYTVVLNPGSYQLTNAQLTLTNPLTGTLSLNTSTTVSSSYAGQFIAYTFSGTASETINLTVGGVTDTSGHYSFGVYYCSTDITIVNPDGTSLRSTNGNCGTSVTWNSLVLPQTGTYTLYLNPYSYTLTSATFILTLTPGPLVASLSLNTPLTVSSSFATQIAHINFTGSSSEKINLSINGLADTGSGNDRFGNYYCNTTINVLNPDGTTLVSNNGSCSGGTAWNDLALSQTGTYTVVLNPGSYQLTNAQLTLTNPLTGTLSLNTSTTVSSSYAGQFIAYTFSGTASETIDLAATGVTDTSGHYSFGVYYCSTDITIVNPDGTVLRSNNGNCGSNNGWSDFVLPQTGTYTLYLNPYSYTLTSAMLTFTNPLMGSLAFGTPITVSSSYYGQYVEETFSGTQSSTISLGITGLTDSGGCDTTDGILNPDGTTLETNNGNCGTNSELNYLVLPQTGTYTVYFNAGSLKLTNVNLNLVNPTNSYGLAGWWTLNEGSGTTAFDSSGNGNNGVWSGTTVGAGSTYYTSANNQSFAGDFDGSTDSVNLGTSTVLAPPAMTFTAWINATALPNSYNSVISREAPGYTLLVKNNGKLAVYVSDDQGNSMDYDGTGSSTISTGNWYFVAFTYQANGSLIGYVNGAVDASTTASSRGLGYTIGLPTLIGNSHYGSRVWDGAIDDVRIYYSALSGSQIMNLYNAGN